MPACLPYSFAMDPFVFDLHNGIALIEEYGMALEELLWLDNGAQTLRHYPPRQLATLPPFLNHITCLTLINATHGLLLLPVRF